MTTGKFFLFNFIVDTNDERRVIGIIEQSLGQGSAAFLFLTFFVQGQPRQKAVTLDRPKYPFEVPLPTPRRRQVTSRWVYALTSAGASHSGSQLMDHACVSQPAYAYGSTLRAITRQSEIFNCFCQISTFFSVGFACN